MPDIGKDFLALSSIDRANALMEKAQESQRAATQGTELSGKIQKTAKGQTRSEQIDKASKDFEALLLHQMFKSMWESVPEDGGLFGDNNESAIYRDMFNEAMANEISNGQQGLGIKEIVAKDLRRLDGYKGK